MSDPMAYNRALDAWRERTQQEKADARLAASHLGSLAKGKPKRLSDAERKRRGLRLAETK